MEKLANEETRTSGGNENKNDPLVIDIITMLEMSEPLVSTRCRIYKVPFYLRKLNEEAYTPQVISIGPIHHDKKRFQTMEKHKVRYFKSFMQRVENQAEIKLENLVSTIREMEDNIRHCYVESVQLESHDFVKMILLDASFILDLFLKNKLKGWTRDDPMRVEAWLLDMVPRELFLLENQLPFFVIEKLYHLALPSLSNSISLIQLTFDFFKFWNIHNKSPSVNIQHFTDLLRFFLLPPTNELPARVPEILFPKYSITQLSEAGVKFKVVPSKYLLDLKFKKGVLEIPRLVFYDRNEALVRNIMALEQCDHTSDQYITDFFSIMDRLINTTKDVDLLNDKGILVNGLGDRNAVTSMINNLSRGILRRDMNCDFYKLCKDLDEYYEEPSNKWKAILRHQYFSTPWRSASTVAAIILLQLTLIQTLFSILQVVL
uniref:Uncharacterized protein n=1 Tax=Fagus sylvatica TaxID=28930 RepID=A0A2N9G5C5_FAGSY